MYLSPHLLLLFLVCFFSIFLCSSTQRRLLNISHRDTAQWSFGEIEDRPEWFTIPIYIAILFLYFWEVQSIYVGDYNQSKIERQIKGINLVMGYVQRYGSLWYTWIYVPFFRWSEGLHKNLLSSHPPQVESEVSTERLLRRWENCFKG